MKLSKIFFIITIIIFHIAVAITSSSYIRMKYAIKYEGVSAPQYVYYWLISLGYLLFRD